mgnify:CR=1 FL=1
MTQAKKFYRVLLCLILLSFTVSISYAAMLRSPKSDNDNTRRSRYSRSFLPENGDIAVIADSTDSQHAAMAEAIIIDQLIENGYRVVDDARLGKIHREAERSKAVTRAFGGNVSGISNIGKSNKVAVTILARVKAGIPERNEAKLYTGTASVTIIAINSNGTKTGGKVFQGKAVGYTIDEARENALTSAIQNGMEEIL